nr:hypothetical protein [Tanacetum cinerariifolium]
MQCFLRLAGFLGAAAGTEEEQAKIFQWGLRRSTLNHLMCMSYTDVAQVANAARNYEILHERDDQDTERPDKRQRSGDRHQPTSQQSSHRSHGQNNDRHGSDRRSAAGTEEEQAKNFQWGLRRSTLNHLMCMSYTDVAQVANAARNYEILHERDDDDIERPDKRKRSGDRHQPTSQQSSHRSHGIPVMDWTRETGVISPTDLPIL